MARHLRQGAPRFSDDSWPSEATYLIRGRLTGKPAFRPYDSGGLVTLAVTVYHAPNGVERFDVMMVSCRFESYPHEVMALAPGCGVEARGSIERRYADHDSSILELRAEPSGLAFYPDGWPGLVETRAQLIAADVESASMEELEAAEAIWNRMWEGEAPPTTLSTVPVATGDLSQQWERVERIYTPSGPDPEPEWIEFDLSKAEAGRLADRPELVDPAEVDAFAEAWDRNVPIKRVYDPTHGERPPEPDDELDRLPSTFRYEVTVEAMTDDLADQAMVNRLDHEAEYGFDYMVEWRPKATSDEPTGGELYLTDVSPELIRIEIEACEPMELLRQPEDVFVRVLPRSSFAPGCDMVELLGTRHQLIDYIERHWSYEGDELFDQYPELR